MLFRRKNCTQCGSSYDVVRETCPACHTRDEHYEELGIPKNIIWLPIYKQLLIFFVGWLGLQIVGEVFALLIYNYISDETLYLMLVNLVRYIIIGGALACILIGNYKDFKKGFTRWWAYLIGIGGVSALLGFSMFYNGIMQIIYPTGPNANQTAINSLLGSYPLFCILVLGILGPVVEELTYRIGLFSFLMRTKRWIVYLVTIVIFALIHFDFMSIIPAVRGDPSDLIKELINLPSYLFAGGVLCVLYDTVGFSASLVAHIGNNLYSIIVSILALKLGLS